MSNIFKFSKLTGHTINIPNEYIVKKTNQKLTKQDFNIFFKVNNFIWILTRMLITKEGIFIKNPNH